MRDERFIRGKIPMTKSEVRAVSLSKLELGEDGIFYDIGAGTGSVSVEAALRLRRGQVYAIEQKAEGCELIRANMEKFGTENIKVVCAAAPEALASLPTPDYVFIGGSGGQFAEIMSALEKRNQNVRIVVNAIALETVAQVLGWLKAHGHEAEIVSVQVARAKHTAGYHMMEGQNPVYVISWGGPDER